MRSERAGSATSLSERRVRLPEPQSLGRRCCSVLQDPSAEGRCSAGVHLPAVHEGRITPASVRRDGGLHSITQPSGRDVRDRACPAKGSTPLSVNGSGPTLA